MGGTFQLAKLGVSKMVDTIANVPYFDPFTFAKDFTKTTVGFDSIFDRLKNVTENLPKVNYPPYNIKKVSENTFVIELAVAGFGKQDIEIELQDGILKVKGQVTADENADYLFKGIADRAFTRSFTLADTVEVKNADLINGMLKIWLERFIPEEKKAKKVPINEPVDVASNPQLLQEKK
jgi:molecular chaperone IbpA